MGDVPIECETAAVEALSAIMHSGLSKNPALAEKQRRLLEALRNDPNLLERLDAADDAGSSDRPCAAWAERPTEQANPIHPVPPRYACTSAGPNVVSPLAWTRKTPQTTASMTQDRAASRHDSATQDP